jgi:DNA repair exonuclease SbcCD ATPase subunit
MESLKLIGLEVENVLRIRSLSLTMPEDGVLVIGGENESGKTSALRAIELAIAGGSAKSADAPIHGDANEGKVLATFGGDDGSRYVLEKTWTRKDGGKPKAALVIKDADGKPKSAPQTLWDSFCDYAALDPVKFLRLDAKEQSRIVSELCGVDLAPFAEERTAAVTARRDANREVKRLHGALASCTHNFCFFPKIPDKEESVADLTAELQKRQAHNAEGLELERTLNDLRSAAKARKTELDGIEATIARLQKELDAALNQRETVSGEIAKVHEDGKAARAALASFQPADQDEIMARISAVEETNKRIRDNARHAALKAELAAAEKIADEKQEALDDVDRREAEAKATAAERVPVQGLDITADGLTYNGAPLADAGRSAGIRIGAAIAMAASKDRPVKLLLIDDGETLSPAHQRQVFEDAAAAGFQVMYTIVSGRGESHVEIVDGIGRTE